jgi:hypothetical protein
VRQQKNILGYVAVALKAIEPKLPIWENRPELRGEYKANMVRSALQFDEIGYWSEIKLEIVRDYAAAYSAILTKKNLQHIYVDAFAGAGQHISKEHRRVRSGQSVERFERTTALPRIPRH